MTQEASIGLVSALSSTPNLFWQIPHWFIDQSNRTGKASDANTGTTANDPVLTWKGGVIAKMGTSSPILNQSTTFTFLSPTPSTGPEDPVFFTPTQKSQTFTRAEGTIDAHNLLGSGVIANHTARNRATGQLEQVDIGAIAGAVSGTLIVNTQAGKSSRAMLYQNVGGTVWSISQPLTIQDNWPNAGNPVPVNTWANGDTFQLFNLDMVDIINFRPVVAEFDNTNANEFTILNLLGIQNPVNTLIGPCYLGDTLGMLYCTSQRRIVLPISAYARNALFYGVAMTGGIAGGPLQTPWAMANGPWLQAGFVTGSTQLIGAVVDLDTILKFANTRMLGGVLSAACIDAGATLFVAEETMVTDWGGGAAGPFVWGTGTVDTKQGSLVIQGTTAVASLLASTLKLNGATTGFSATKANPSVIVGNVNVTPANVDANSTLWTPGGGSIRVTG